MQEILFESRDRRLLLLVLSTLLVSTLAAAALDFLSLLIYIPAFLLFIVVVHLISPGNVVKASFAFAIYSFITITIYYFQFISFPEFNGLSGARGFGTDDTKFFYEAATGHGYRHFGELVQVESPLHPFSILLRGPALFIGLFKDVSPLDLLFVNVFVVSFTPIFVYKIAQYFSNSKKISRMAYLLTLICPMISTNGLILVRDGWTAALFIGALYFFVRNRYILFLLLTSLLFYIRIASGIQLLVILLLFFILSFRTSKRSAGSKLFMILMISAGAILAYYYILMPIVNEYIAAQNISFYREDYVEGFLNDEDDGLGGDSTLFMIKDYPYLIRAILSFLFFFGSPFFTAEFTFQGMFIPRFFINQSFAILFIFYLKWFVQAVFFAFKRNVAYMKTFIYSYFALILVISQVSLQIRHKTMIMPLFYIIAAYGIYHNNKIGRYLGAVAAVFLAFFEIVYFIVKT